MTITCRTEAVVKQLKLEELWPVLDYMVAHFPRKEFLAEPINVPYLAASWSGLMQNGSGVAYATFFESKPSGVLLGLLTPDLHNGKLQGVEFFWTGKNTLPLLNMFEAECKSRGCYRIVVGLWAQAIGPRAPGLRRFYRSRGFQPEAESFSKVL